MMNIIKFRYTLPKLQVIRSEKLALIQKINCHHDKRCCASTTGLE
jgi:hypothetical protein